MSDLEKLALQQRLQEIQAKERAEFFAKTEHIWTTYVLPLLNKSRRTYARGHCGNAPIVLTLHHRRGAYRTGLQGGGVWILKSSGKLLGKIVTPERPANMAWGDEDGKTLYFTAHSSIYKVRVNTGKTPNP